MKHQSNKQQVIRKFKKAFSVAAIAYDNANREAISEVNYWAGFENRVTLRQNGQVVAGANRNILDLGNLANSQHMVIDDYKATYTWDGDGVTPVVMVHEGGDQGNGFIPGRPWTDLAYVNADLPTVFKENFQ